MIPLLASIMAQALKRVSSKIQLPLALKLDDVEIFKSLVKDGLVPDTKLVFQAVECKALKIFRCLCVFWSCNIPDNITCHVASSGNIEMMTFCRDMGFDLSGTMEIAAEKGHHELVFEMQSWECDYDYSSIEEGFDKAFNKKLINDEKYKEVVHKFYSKTYGYPIVSY